jgi:cytochrome c2
MTIKRITITSFFIVLLSIVLIGCETSPNPPQAAETEIAEIAQGDPARGELLFRRGIGVGPVPACINCHAFRPSGLMLGPVISGVGERAGTRVPDLSAAEYLRQSILEPSAFLVPGYGNRMFADYADHFTDQEIADLIAYLETL